MLQENLVEKDQLVPVDGAPLFVVGDAVLLVDEEGTLERAQVTKTTPEELAFRSLNGPGGQIENPFRREARVLKVREVGFYLKKDSMDVVVLARKATGQAEQTLARYVGALEFEYLDEAGEAMDPRRIGPGLAPGGVRITLGLLPNPTLPRVTVPPLSLRVSLEPQSATVAFDAFAFHRVGVAGVIGQDPASAERKIGMHGWRKTTPVLSRGERGASLIVVLVALAALTPLALILSDLVLMRQRQVGGHQQNVGGQAATRGGLDLAMMRLRSRQIALDWAQSAEFELDEGPRAVRVRVTREADVVLGLDGSVIDPEDAADLDLERLAIDPTSGAVRQYRRLEVYPAWTPSPRALSVCGGAPPRGAGAPGRRRHVSRRALRPRLLSRRGATRHRRRGAPSLGTAQPHLHRRTHRLFHGNVQGQRGQGTAQVVVAGREDAQRFEPAPGRRVLRRMRRAVAPPDEEGHSRDLRLLDAERLPLQAGAVRPRACAGHDGAQAEACIAEPSARGLHVANDHRPSHRRQVGQRTQAAHHPESGSPGLRGEDLDVEAGAERGQRVACPASGSIAADHRRDARPLLESPDRPGPDRGSEDQVIDLHRGPEGDGAGRRHDAAGEDRSREGGGCFMPAILYWRRFRT